MGIYTVCEITFAQRKAVAFPAPIEVVRELYLNLQLSRWMMRGKSSRPLSRLIGSYTGNSVYNAHKKERFPAPREVDRELYVEILAKNAVNAMFPAPRDVDR